MAYTSEKIKKGNDLMLFIKKDGAYKSVAFATNHTLSLTTETEDIQSKDSGYDGAVMAKKVSWEIQSENLYIESEFKNLLSTMLGSNKYLDVVWGGAVGDVEHGITATDETPATDKNFTPATSGTYYGKALISSLTLNTNAGENATYSITLTGSGTFNEGNPPA